MNQRAIISCCINYLKPFLTAPVVSIVSCGTLVFGISQAVSLASPEEVENIVLLTILALAVLRNGLPQQQTPSRGRSRFLSWPLLAIAAAITYPTGLRELKLDLPLGVFLLAWAVAIHQLGFRASLRLLPGNALSCLCLPFQETLFLAFSYPLRLISTVLAGTLLQWCGAPVDYELTTLTVGSSQLAITDACSGISQLAALTLIGYLLVRHRHRRLLCRAGHFLTLLPAVILANTLRLLLTVVFFLMLGDVVLQNTWHMALGYFLVFTALLLFWAFGALFPEDQAK